MNLGEIIVRLLAPEIQRALDSLSSPETVRKITKIVLDEIRGQRVKTPRGGR